ncbi:MAG: sugar nucleotide-binding protein [Flavobacteriia bacterium]|nr:sugar nucleotide-binding protein [Flavobacteriia bacterium]
MKKILVLGASGSLGSRIHRSISNSYGTFFSYTPVNKSNMFYLDASNLNHFSKLLNEIQPDAVINCIGFTNVDDCEEFPEKSWIINCKLPADIAEICKLNDVKFVHISTDHYLNKSNDKLLETGAVGLVNQYSFAKFYAEKMIMTINQNAIVIRTNFFHFDLENPTSFLDKLIISSINKVMTQSYNDVWFTPISTRTLILYLNKLLELNFSGLINISSNEVMSKYDFHQNVLDCLKVSKDLHRPFSIDDVKLRALRPKYMALDNKKLEETTGIKTPTIYDMIAEEI